jgi:hypothetical protein
MPELPEVETVRRGLAPVMEGVQIARADVNRPDLRWPFPEGMADRLTGKTVLRLRRRSKYILADLDSGETLLIHLGMSGRMTISGIRWVIFIIRILPLRNMTMLCSTWRMMRASRLTTPVALVRWI